MSGAAVKLQKIASEVDGMSMPAGEFKAKCLELMDEVQERHMEVVITKRGRPVAKLVPVESEPKDLFGALKGAIRIKGDVIKPVDEAWEADA